LESQRFDQGATPATRLPTVFREWVLDEWILTGPAQTWDTQLEQRYSSAPVFAVLSGRSNGSWQPIGRFCERHAIPCLFPSTDVPEAAEGDYYTFYFSRGLELEADLVARAVVAAQVPTVVQVYCGTAPMSAARRLRAGLAAHAVAVVDIEFACEDPLPLAQIAAPLKATPAAAMVLWVRSEQLLALQQPLPIGRVYASSTLLGPDPAAALVGAQGPVFVAQPFRRPAEPDVALRRFAVWARTRGINVSDPRHQAEAFFACIATNDAVMHLRRFFLRDYLLDSLDHSQGLAAYVPLYPRPTLGPGQRFISKGGYVLPLGTEPTAPATWLVP
jgi:hypothetical protein